MPDSRIPDGEGSKPLPLRRRGGGDPGGGDPGGPCEIDPDGVAFDDGRFWPWLLLREAEMTGGALRLLFRTPDGRLSTLVLEAEAYDGWDEIAARARAFAPDAWRDRPSGRDASAAAAVPEALPRIASAAAAAAVATVVVARTASSILHDRLAVDLRSFLGRHDPEAFLVFGLVAGVVSAEWARRAAAAPVSRGPTEERLAGEIARRMEAAGASVEVRHRVRSVEWAWRCRRGTWERAVFDRGREAWRGGATPAEARAALARLLAAGASLIPGPVKGSR